MWNKVEFKGYNNIFYAIMGTAIYESHGSESKSDAERVDSVSPCIVMFYGVRIYFHGKT